MDEETFNLLENPAQMGINVRLRFFGKKRANTMSFKNLICTLHLPFADLKTDESRIKNKK